MGLLDFGVVGRIRGLIASVTSDFKLAFSRQGGELRRVREELQQALRRIEASERQIQTLQADNADLRGKLEEIRRNWATFQAVAGDAGKIQQLITAFKRIKKELLENRRSCDLNVNTIDELRHENARLLRKLESMASDDRIDVGELREHVATLRRELTAVSLKAEQQDRLIKSLKEREEKLVASLKRNM